MTSIQQKTELERMLDDVYDPFNFGISYDDAQRVANQFAYRVLVGLIDPLFMLSGEPGSAYGAYVNKMDELLKASHERDDNPIVMGDPSKYIDMELNKKVNDIITGMGL